MAEIKDLEDRLDNLAWKHDLTILDFLSAVASSFLELHPELRKQRGLKEYTKRISEARKEATEIRKEIASLKVK